MDVVPANKLLSEKGYEYIKHLGSGGYGHVSLYRKFDGTQVAAKEIHKENLSKGNKKSLLKELYSLENLSNKNSQCNPHVVCIFEVIESDKYFIIITEYIDGPTLTLALNELDTNTPFESSATILRWMIDIAEAVEYMHSKNFVHRDIKPDNIMIDYPTNDSNGNAKLIDLGMTCVESKNSSETNPYACTNSMKGTPNFMAPEVFEKRIRDFEYSKIDIYSLGKLFFVMATGKTPTSKAKNFNDVWEMVIKNEYDEISTGAPQLDVLIKDMLSYDAKNRPTATQTVEKLQEINNNPIFRRFWKSKE